jgi:prepilin-type N-terminal cleavage/methylation domain-containing protein
MRTPATKGFTLIELMVVVTILAVLSIVAITSYKYYTVRAQAQEARQLLMEIQMKQESYFSTYSEYVTANPGAVDFTNLYPPAGQTAKFADGAADASRFDWTPMDCSNPATNEVGWCNLGFRPQGATYFRLGTWGWNPAAPNLPGTPSDPEFGLISGMDTSQRWYFGVAMRDYETTGAKAALKATLIMTSQTNEIVATNITR